MTLMSFYTFTWWETMHNANLVPFLISRARTGFQPPFRGRCSMTDLERKVSFLRLTQQNGQFPTCVLFLSLILWSVGA